jgi:Protein of unknown function (DUF2510)
MSEESAVAATATGSRPAAWHPDPSGRHQLRWWGGERWTDQVSDDGRITTDPPVQQSVAADEAPEGAAVEEPNAEPEERDHRIDILTPVEPPAPARRRSAGPTSEAGERPLWARLVVPVAATVVVLAVLFWGWQTAMTGGWQEPADAVAAQIDTHLANATVAQAQACTRRLDRVASEAAQGDVRESVLRQAQRACGGAEDAAELLQSTRGAVAG